MKYVNPLIPARLIRRYKRFLADVRMPDAETMTVHCPNTGAMLGCDIPESRVMLSTSDNPKRKYRHTWELVESSGTWVGIHSAFANALVAEAVEGEQIDELCGYPELRREVPYDGGRLDMALSAPKRRECMIEVKSVTAAVEQGVALFPDARSIRGARHADDLASMVALGHRAVLLFCVQRGDVDVVRPADEIDPAYGIAVRRAAAAGVEILAYSCDVSPERIQLSRKIPVDL